ncbi:hypothetical protein [Micromonospora violae]|uniref:hypothetical protein n=1 Tax=Micromonospora violae TaxID=1278207 RepID=UPI003409DC22
MRPTLIPAGSAWGSGLEVTVFRVAYARWVAPDSDAPLTGLIAEVATELRAITSATG